VAVLALATTAGTCAAVVMGDTGTSDNAFSQLFTRPAGSTSWKLVTPPGVATNGGFVLATQGSRSLIAGFRPGVDLTFSALTSTGDDGTNWQPGSPLQPGLADVPDSLAAAPGGGRMLALLLGGTVTQSTDQGAHWTTLPGLRSLAATAAGRHCSPAALTGVSLTPAGTALAASPQIACSTFGAGGDTPATSRRHVLRAAYLRASGAFIGLSVGRVCRPAGTAPGTGSPGRGRRVIPLCGPVRAGVIPRAPLSSLMLQKSGFRGLFQPRPRTQVPERQANTV
jgi:hypothetical protein